MNIHYGFCNARIGLDLANGGSCRAARGMKAMQSDRMGESRAVGGRVRRQQAKKRRSAEPAVDILFSITQISRSEISRVENRHKKFMNAHVASMARDAYVQPGLTANMYKAGRS